MNSKISKILNAVRTFWSKAGAIDKPVDAIIEKSVLDAIDIL